MVPWGTRHRALGVGVCTRVTVPVCACVLVPLCTHVCVYVCERACVCIRVLVPSLHITKGAEPARHAGNVEIAGASRQDSDETGGGHMAQSVVHRAGATDPGWRPC